MKPEEKKNKFEGIIKMLGELTGITQSGPKGMDLKTKDGKMLSVQSEDGEFTGKPATMDGQPANGTYMLEDGRSITCENGVVMSVQQAAAAVATTVPPVTPPPAPPVVPAAQTADEKLAAMQADIQALKAQKEASDKAKAAAEQSALTAQKDKETALTKVAEVQKEIVALSKQEVGDQNPPSKGMKPILGPAAAGFSNDEKDRTIAYLSEQMGWLKQYYPKGYFEKSVEAYVSKMGGSGPNAVSILETNFNYTYPGILTTDIFYKPSLSNPALSDIFTIDQGIKSHKQYNLVNPISKILKPYTGCDRVFNNNRALITNTTVRTKEFQVNESWCKDDFTNYLTGGFNVLAQEWLKTGMDSFDPSGTPIAKIIDNVLSNALRIDTFRRISFAAGNSSDDDYNQIDGLWDRLIDSSGASNYCVVRASATNGAGAVGFGTGTLAANAALTALESAYANSNILLKDWDNIYAQFSGAVQKPTFWVTRSVWDNYYNSLIANGAVTQVTEQSFENLQKGLTSLMYKGYPVRPVSLWDQFLAESDNPLFATTRHLVLFTTKDNHILGLENGADLNKLEGWYERKDRKFYYEADMKMGYNYLHCDLQTIVY